MDEYLVKKCQTNADDLIELYNLLAQMGFDKATREMMRLQEIIADQSELVWYIEGLNK